MQQAIAILDSGVGGLTVVKEVMRVLPKEQILYFGDTARAPYGSKPAKEIIRYIQEIIHYFLPDQPKMIVIACNTATAVALETIRDKINVPIIGVIQPGARTALGRSETGRIGIIGTERTIQSRAYERALQQLSNDIRISSRACPAFVPLVEAGKFGTPEAQHIVNESLRGMRVPKMDCLILGCTHYPFLTSEISRTMGKSVTLINSAEETAREVREVLIAQKLLASGDSPPAHRFACSGDLQTFQSIAALWLGDDIRELSITWKVAKLT